MKTAFEVLYKEDETAVKRMFVAADTIERAREIFKNTFPHLEFMSVLMPDAKDSGKTQFLMEGEKFLHG
jgi:hypothetical protein